MVKACKSHKKTGVLNEGNPKNYLLRGSYYLKPAETWPDIGVQLFVHLFVNICYRPSINLTVSVCLGATQPSVIFLFGQFVGLAWRKKMLS